MCRYHIRCKHSVLTHTKRAIIRNHLAGVLPFCFCGVYRNETCSSGLAAVLPLRGGELSAVKGLFDLNTYLVHFYSLMWCSEAITLICGQAQVSCINHDAQMFTFSHINTLAHKYAHRQKEMVRLQTSNKWR